MRHSVFIDLINEARGNEIDCVICLSYYAELVEVSAVAPRRLKQPKFICQIKVRYIDSLVLGGAAHAMVQTAIASQDSPRYHLYGRFGWRK